MCYKLAPPLFYYRYASVLMSFSLNACKTYGIYRLVPNTELSAICVEFFKCVVCG